MQSTDIVSQEAASTSQLSQLRPDSNDLNVESGLGYKRFEDMSRASMPVCGTSCSICREDFLPLRCVIEPLFQQMPEMDSDEEAATEVARFTETAMNDRNILRQQIASSGDAIAKRWQNRTVSNRAKAVRQALPDAYPHKYAQACIWQDHKRQAAGTEAVIRSRGTPHRRKDKLKARTQKFNRHIATQRTPLLLPYLDVETLSEDPMNFLALLCNRADAELQDFVLIDAAELRTAFQEMQLPAKWNPHCVLMHGERYGQLTAWEEGAAHRREIMGYPLASLVLEAQATLYSFLRKVITMLLAPEPRSIPTGRSQLGALAASEFQSSAGSSRKHPTAFRPPPVFSIDYLLASLIAQRNAMRDDLELLQTEPLFLRDLLVHVKNTMCLPKARKTDEQKLLLKVLVGAKLSCDALDTLVRVAEHLASPIREHASEVRIGEAMPTAMEEAMTMLKSYLATYLAMQRQELGMLSVLSNVFGSYMRAGEGGHYELQGDLDNCWKRGQKLAWNIGCLINEHQPELPVTFHLDFIDSLLEQDAKTMRSGINRLLLKHLSAMTVVNDALEALRSHRPGSATVVRGTRHECESAFRDAYERSISYGFCGSLPGSGEPEALLQAFLAMPVPSAKPSRRSIDEHKALHGACEALWDAFARCLGSTLRWLLGCDVPTVENVVANTRLRHGEAFRKELAAELAALEEEIWSLEHRKQLRTTAESNSNVPSPVAFCFNQATSISTTVAAPLCSQKVKTRPLEVARRFEPDNGLVGRQEQAPELEARFQPVLVNQESLDIFRQMFPRKCESKGSVRWPAFVSAMEDAGFTVEPVGGSEYSFRDARTGGRIVFHRPHPDPALSQTLLRIQGKRLRRWFGWDVGTFVAREGAGRGE